MLFVNALADTTTALRVSFLPWPVFSVTAVGSLCVPLAETSTGVGQQGFLVTLEGEAPITAACVDCGNSAAVAM